jgi:hypothetical protein
VRKLVVNTDPFTIGKTHFTDAKLYFKLTMMKAPQSPPNHQEEGKVDSKSSK